MNAFSLQGRSALVTGSSRGIGHAIATALRAAGAAVVDHGLDETAPADPARYLRHDLLATDGPAALVEAAFAIDPGLDLLICNAGSFFDTDFLAMTPERWEKTMALNLRAPYFVVQAFAAKLAAAGRPGAVVMTTSTNGFQPELKSTAYDVSKGGAVMMVRTLALNLADHGIRVNGIAPGLIRTPLTGWIDRDAAKREHYEKKIALGRVGEVEDCAQTCVYLCSEAARYITGQIVTIDGGLTLSQIGKQ